MLPNAAIERMTEVAEESAERLRALGYLVTVEIDYMNAFLKSVDNPAKARFITVSAVITSPETPKGDEYCLSLGAEIRYGKIDDAQLERDICGFGKMVEESVTRLSEFESKSEGVSVLANEASKEYEALVEKLNSDQKKQRLLSAIGMILVIIGIIVLFAVATLS